MKRILSFVSSVVILGALIAGVFSAANAFFPRHIQDEALQAGRTADSFPAATEDYFHEMDGGAALSQAEIAGRNTWLVWTGGNDRLWDILTVSSFGTLDFLKTISSHPGLPANRENRWSYLGVVNEPCFEKATGPDPTRYGLWLDKRVVSASCPPDPFENVAKYPGVRFGARGKTGDAGSYYGYASGIVGLRYFPNPAFDAKAAHEWDPVRYYNDPAYYARKNLVRPYRVGMSCAFCHVGPNPIDPPKNPEHPTWANLSSNVGAQFFWFDRIFDWKGTGDGANYLYQLLHTYRPGALDTSLISSDNINNPRTMNALYLLGPRLEHAKRFGKERLACGGLNNHQFNDFVSSGPLTQYFSPPDTVFTPHVLKDGADSVGALGAFNRVYINIGTDSEEWLEHFNALVGGTPVSPIRIDVARQNSAYFKATEAQTPGTALFFLKTTGAHHLRDAPGGAKYLTNDAATLTRGKIVFAETCARCHSSKLPEPIAAMEPAGCAGRDYLTCWNAYFAYTATKEFKEKMRSIVLAKDFLTDNYLSSEFRVPNTLLHTNACSPLATNAIAGNIWDNFSSQSYKDLPSIGKITVYDPFTGEPGTYEMPAGGRGYTRPPSLVSLWSTAPYLLNNSVGTFDADPSVEARMRRFQNGIEQMLWPDKRDHDAVLGTKIPGVIDRTTQPSFLHVDVGYLPFVLRKLHPKGITIGPIPAGTPVDLLANLNLAYEGNDLAGRLAHDKKVLALLLRLGPDLVGLKTTATDDRARAKLRNLVAPLLALSKCPDFVVNRGHYFGTGFVEPGQTGPTPPPSLSDDDKRALIEFLKTF